MQLSKPKNDCEKDQTVLYWIYLNLFKSEEH